MIAPIFPLFILILSTCVIGVTRLPELVIKTSSDFKSSFIENSLSINFKFKELIIFFKTVLVTPFKISLFAGCVIIFLPFTIHTFE